MQRHLTVLALLILGAASCSGTPDRGSEIAIADGVYSREHVVPELTDGLAKVSDEIHIRVTSPTQVRFHIFSVGKNLHVCDLAGIATAQSSGHYSSNVRGCALRLAVKGQELLLDVESDSGLGQCKPTETLDSACGVNGNIESGVYAKIEGEVQL